MHGEQYQPGQRLAISPQARASNALPLQAAALRTLCQALVPDSARYPISQVGLLSGVYHSADDDKACASPRECENASRNAALPRECTPPAMPAPSLLQPSGHGGARTAGVAGAGAAYGH